MSNDDSNKKTNFSGDEIHSGNGIARKPAQNESPMSGCAGRQREGAVGESESKKITGVYLITNLFDGKQYVGSSSTSIRSRIAVHKKMLRNREHHSYLLQKAWCRCGESAFDFEILEICDPLECISKEQHWIDALSPNYNICKKAGSPIGTKRTEEVRAKMRGRKHPTRSQYTRDLLSAAMKGRVFSEESIQKMRTAKLGKVLSEETKQKLRIASMGNKYGLGYIASPELREIRRLLKLGKKQNPEAVEKTRIAHIGMKRSQECRAKMSAAAKARCATLEGRTRLRNARWGEKNQYENSDLLQGFNNRSVHCAAAS